jgi:hypothetical protein
VSHPRTPLSRAQATGRTTKDPARFASRRRVTQARPLGQPPSWLTAEQRKAWALFAAELPWLNGAHRAILELASVLRARLMSGETPGVNALTLYRQTLGQLGGTPADESKIQAPAPEDDGDNLAARYLGGVQ